jgi:hypothetical protein
MNEYRLDGGGKKHQIRHMHYFLLAEVFHDIYEKGSLMKNIQIP